MSSPQQKIEVLIESMNSQVDAITGVLKRFKTQLYNSDGDFSEGVSDLLTVLFFLSTFAQAVKMSDVTQMMDIYKEINMRQSVKSV